MSSEGDFDYALARVQARHGARLREAQWRRLEASRELEHFLEAVRSSALAPWCFTIDPSDDAHVIERALRAEWRRYVAEVASWHPLSWQPWLEWLAWLPTLPLLERLARAEPAPEWMLADPVCGPLAPGSPSERSSAIRHTPLAPLAPAIGGHGSLGTLWGEHWRRLIPRVDADSAASIEVLLRLTGRYAAALRVADSSHAADRDLSGGLVRCLRRSVGMAARTACHLALLGRDIERLRGGLVIRRLFPVRAGIES